MLQLRAAIALAQPVPGDANDTGKTVDFISTSNSVLCVGPDAGHESNFSPGPEQVSWQNPAGDHGAKSYKSVNPGHQGLRTPP